MSYDCRYNLSWTATPDCKMPEKDLSLFIKAEIEENEDAEVYLDTNLERLGQSYETGSWCDVNEWMASLSSELPGVWFKMHIIGEDGEQYAIHALGGKVEEVSVRIVAAPPSWAKWVAAGVGEA